MTDITYCDLSVESLDLIKPLWEKLNEHHRTITPHFAKDFENRAFEMRKKEMMAEGKRLRIFTAGISGDETIGYCIASLKVDQKEGEIESIFIDSRYRGAGIGSELMRRVLDWLDGNGVAGIAIHVVVGNEDALPFYQKFGFFPRVYRLKRKCGESNRP